MDRLQYLNELSPSTRNTYRSSLKIYFNYIYGKGGELSDLIQIYFSEQRDYGKDISGFLASLNGKPPKSVNLYLSCVKTFLIENDVELPEKYWRRLNGRVKGNRARTKDKVPSNEQLKKIIINMPINGKALFLTLSSSGMRIGETLKLELSDVYLDESPVRIDVRGEITKSGNRRTTFISSEAKEYLEDYLKIRERYLATSVKRSRFGKSTTDMRLFPFDDGTAQIIWTRAIEKANLNGKDKSTNRYECHPHTLRSFFRSRMSTLIPVDFVEELMGHEGYLTKEYRRHSDQELAKFYLQGETSLIVFGGSIKQIQQQVDAKVDSKIEVLQKVITNLSVENLELRRRVSIVEQGWEHFRVVFSDLVKLHGQKETEAEILKLWHQYEDKEAERQRNFNAVVVEARRNEQQ